MQFRTVLKEKRQRAPKVVNDGFKLFVEETPSGGEVIKLSRQLYNLIGENAIAVNMLQSQLAIVSPEQRGVFIPNKSRNIRNVRLIEALDTMYPGERILELVETDKGEYDVFHLFNILIPINDSNAVYNETAEQPEVSRALSSEDTGSESSDSGTIVSDEQQDNEIQPSNPF